MADKQPKAKPARSNDYTPKAGPKSASGGRNKRRGRVGNASQLDILSLAKQDRIEQAKQRREERESVEAAKQQLTLSQQHDARAAQAELAKSLITKPLGVTRDLVELMIDNFVIVAPNKDGKFYKFGTDVEITRTAAAAELAIDQMSARRPTSPGCIKSARDAANKALVEAFHRRSTRTKVASASSAPVRELANA